MVSMHTFDREISSSSTQTIRYAIPDENDGFMNLEVNTPTMITGGIALVMVLLIALIIRKKSIPFGDEQEEIHGPPITNGPPVSQTATHIQQTSPEIQSSSPVLPEAGLPDGWSMEQWEHYGQQYLDRLGKQP